MAALLNWGRQNPKKAGLLSMIGLITGVKKAKQLLATPKQLQDKIVVITGGACGLGRLISMRLYAKGSKVYIWDVNKTAINECNQIKPNHLGGEIIAKFVDVTKRKSVFDETELILKRDGRIDILVQNAGVVAGRPLLELTEKDIQRTFDVNIISHFWTLQAILPKMIERKNGHIVNIISTSAMCPVSHLTDYGTTKAAARSLDIGIKRELTDLGQIEGIVISGIYPHFMNTGMFQGAVNSDAWWRNLWTGKEMLDPKFVADETIKAIEYEKREVILPWQLGKWLYFSQLLPHEVQDDAAVKSNSMHQFKGGQNRLINQKSKL